MGAMSNHTESVDGGKQVKQLGIIHHDVVQTDTSCSNSIDSTSGNYAFTSIDDMSNASGASASERLEKGHLQYGCSHYRRRCRIRAPCCNEIFDCRHCHNEAKVKQSCINCGVSMGKYFCETCKFFDDDTSKQQYHCNGCGICRTGGQENFFHCYKCGCCYSISLKDSHSCVEGAMHHDCPVCFEYLFESTSDVTVLPCGHTIHVNCLKEMQHHLQYACPLCSKSVCDMSKVWEKLDKEIAGTPMPELYSNKTVCILCNDCGANSDVPFHVVGQKCPNCRSYNTRRK